MFQQRSPFILLIVFPFLIGISACTETTPPDHSGRNPLFSETIVENTNTPEKSEDGFPYDLKTPDRKFILPGSLEEVSGLTWVSENQLGCVQDEDGYLFFYDIAKGKIDHKVKFGKRGDYEGVEKVGDSFWVVRSNGKLSFIPSTEGIEVKSEKIETPLNADDDIEGLGYDDQREKLLLITKANSGEFTGGSQRVKAVFEADPTTGELNTQPLFIIDPVVLATFKGKEKPIDFHPSGISLHPTRPEVYLVSAVNSRLLVLNRESGEILFLKKLKSKSFKQAEGICFSPQGTMYISNEGAGGSPNILEFSMLD